MKKLLPLHAMAENFGLVSKSLRPKLGRRSYFTAEGKVALMFLKMYTGLSCPKLMEQLNGNIHYQMFCDMIIDPTRPLTNYKLLDDIMSPTLTNTQFHSTKFQQVLTRINVYFNTPLSRISHKISTLLSASPYPVTFLNNSIIIPTRKLPRAT